MPPIKIFNREIAMPQQKWLRIVLGVSLVLGGILGFLPIVGFWMLPLGFIVLSVDIPLVRRFTRKVSLRWAKWRQSKAKKTRQGRGDDKFE